MTEKKPPNQPIKSIEYDFFSRFVTNDISEVSNTVEYWERIPKYFLTPRQITKLRTPIGHPDPYEREYTINVKQHDTTRVTQFKVEIQPALIKQKNGEYLAFFPTKTEETMEEVLKKIFSDQQYGIHDPKNLESWVRFSYSMIRRELYRVGNSLRYDQIRHSLSVMSKCVITVWEEGKEVYTGNILQDYCSIDRNKYLEDTEALHVARLPVFISHALNTQQYRQYNYVRFMECKEQLTRFLYKRLINRFTQASYMTEYPFMYSEIKQASGLLQCTRDIDNRVKVISAFKELKDKGVILYCEVDERKKGRKVVEVKYTVKGTSDFIREQKAANKRTNDVKTNTPNPSRLLVDKSGKGRHSDSH